MEGSRLIRSLSIRRPIPLRTSRQSCSKAGKARIFALVWGSGESRRGTCARGNASMTKPLHSEGWIYFWPPPSIGDCFSIA